MPFIPPPEAHKVGDMILIYEKGAVTGTRDPIRDHFLVDAKLGYLSTVLLIIKVTKETMRVAAFFQPATLAGRPCFLSYSRKDIDSFLSRPSGHRNDAITWKKF